MRPCLDWPGGSSPPGRQRRAVAAALSPAHERKRLSRLLDAPSNERLPTRCDKARGQQRLSQRGGPSREEADRIESAGVESHGSRRRDRPRHAFLPGACRACKRRRHRTGPLRGAAHHDEEWPDPRAKRAFCAARAGHSADLRHPRDGAAVGRPVLGLSDRGATPTGDRELRPLRYISAIYADRFDSYSGQKLQVTGEQTAPAGVRVKSQIVKANGEPVKIDYMMRRKGESGLISDIYLDGAIRGVAPRRSEFAAI